MPTTHLSSPLPTGRPSARRCASRPLVFLLQSGSPLSPSAFLFGIVGQAGRVFDALLEAVCRWYVSDLARDCVVPVLQRVEDHRRPRILEKCIHYTNL